VPEITGIVEFSPPGCAVGDSRASSPAWLVAPAAPGAPASLLVLAGVLLPQPARMAAVEAQTTPTNRKLCKVLKTNPFF